MSQTIVLRDDGGWAAGPNLSSLQEVGVLPPGALGYVRTKAATICRAGLDIEFHQLSRAVHLAGNVAAWIRSLSMPVNVAPLPSPTRGVWGPDGFFYVEGVALCDWWREKSPREQRAWLLANARPVQRVGRIFRYFTATG